MEEPIFIVGVPRSGTTLVRMILNAHSRIGIAPETHFFPLFWRFRERYGDLYEDHNLKKFWEDFSRSKYFRDFRFSESSMIRESIFSGERSYKSIFETLLKEYAQQHNKARWGEKTPDHLQFVDTILAFYPDAKIIHVIRDPRDVVLSFKKVPWGSTDVFSTARLWNRYIDMSRNFGRDRSNSFLEMRYEDLVFKPEESIKTLCQFVDEKPEGKMLNFHRHTKEYVEKNEPWKEECLHPLTQSNVGKWRRELTRFEAQQVSVKCRSRMMEKGYMKRQGKLSYPNTCLFAAESLVFCLLWALRGTRRRVRKITGVYTET
jgi:hypothetical protein